MEANHTKPELLLSVTIILVVLPAILLGCKGSSSSQGSNPSSQGSTDAVAGVVANGRVDDKATTAPRGALIFSDKFEGMSGTRTSYRKRSWEYEDPKFTRQVFPFGDAQAEGLATQILEDTTTKGADSMAGVLALTWQEIPSQFRYSGFAYMGLREKMLRLPEMAAAKSTDDLRAVQLRFKFKGLNLSDDNRAFSVNCRMEVNVSDSYEFRLELPRLNANSEWQTFELLLSDGNNAEKFLSAIQSNPDLSFKIVWSQINLRHGLLPGDTLLIDDIEISTTKERIQQSDPIALKESPSEEPVSAPLEGVKLFDLSESVTVPASQFARITAFPWPVVPTGKQVISGIPWDISGATNLWGSKNASMGLNYQKSCEFAANGAIFENLYILHSAFFPSDADSPVYDVVIKHVDGKEQIYTVRYLRDTIDWFSPNDENETELTGRDSRVTWREKGKARGRDQWIRFCLTAIELDHPKEPIESIRLVSSEGETAACVLGITGGPRGIAKLK